MHIAYFADSTRIGGAERFMAGVIEGAAGAGHRVTVLSPSSDLLSFLGEGAPDATLRTVASAGYHGTAGATRARDLAGSLRPLVTALRAARPDILHVNNGGYPGSDLCRLATWAGAAARVPRRIMSVNSMPWPREHSQPQLQALLDAVTWRAVHDVTVPARIVGEELVKVRGLPRAKLGLLHYGVKEPSDDGVAELRARLAPPDAFLVGMVTASTSKEKGFDVLLDALERTPPDVRCVIVGPHPENGFTERAAGFGERLVLEGSVPAVNAYYHAIDALVLPSTAYEAMPLVILEAGAARRPSIGSRLSGVPEAIEDGETGDLVTPGDAQELADAIARAASDPERVRRQGEAARLRWEQEFSTEALVRHALELYDGTRQTPNR